MLSYPSKSTPRHTFRSFTSGRRELWFPILMAAIAALIAAGVISRAFAGMVETAI